MCEPATIMAGIGLVASVGGQIMSSSAQAQQLKHQQAVAQRNQQLANMQADDALVRSKIETRDIADRGRIEEQRYRVQASQLISTQKSALAANGVVLNDDESAGQSLIDSRATAELDAQTIKTNTRREIYDRAYAGEQEAFGNRIQASNFASDASMLAAQAKNARTAGVFNAGTTLLSGASKVHDRWKKYKDQD